MPKLISQKIIEERIPNTYPGLYISLVTDSIYLMINSQKGVRLYSSNGDELGQYDTYYDLVPFYGSITITSR